MPRLKLIGLPFFSALVLTVLISTNSVTDQKKVFAMDHGTHSSSANKTHTEKIDALRRNT
ncbi:MAG: hypothetical protein OSA22_01780 [Aquiluna sp.]|nr:hypothetical protein [Aquiluna sp.]